MNEVEKCDHVWEAPRAGDEISVLTCPQICYKCGLVRQKPMVCPHCLYEWEPRKEKPKTCPRCKQYLEKREKLKGNIVAIQLSAEEFEQAKKDGFISVRTSAEEAFEVFNTKPTSKKVKRCARE